MNSITALYIKTFPNIGFRPMFVEEASEYDGRIVSPGTIFIYWFNKETNRATLLIGEGLVGEGIYKVEKAFREDYLFHNLKDFAEETFPNGIPRFNEYVDSECVSRKWVSRNCENEKNKWSLKATGCVWRNEVGTPVICWSHAECGLVPGKKYWFYHTNPPAEVREQIERLIKIA